MNVNMLTTQQVLVWRSKYDVEYWDASTEDLKAWALQQLFDACKDLGYYGNCEGESTYEKAKAGDTTALAQFLQTRSLCEYEEWEYVLVKSPSHITK